MEDVFVHYVEHAPTGFHGCVTCNEDGSHSVFLDPNDSRARQLKAYFHELNKHIKGADFAKDNVQEIEGEAHE